MAVPVTLFAVAVVVGAVGLVRGLRGLVVAGVLIAAAAVVFVVVLDDPTLDASDAAVFAWILGHRSPAATSVARAISLVGGTVWTGGVAVVAAAVLAWRRRWWTAAVWVVTVAFGSLVIRLLKEAVERPRPPVPTRLAVETTASLPSGHALMAALGLGLAAVAVRRLVRPPLAGALAMAVAVVLAAAIGLSRAYLGVHWTTDLLAGWLLGAALAVIGATVATVLEARPASTRPHETPARR